MSKDSYNNYILLQGQENPDDQQHLKSCTAISQLENEQKELFDKLCIESSNFDSNQWIESFKAFSKKNKRFLYSRISSYIITADDDTHISTILTNIKKVTDLTQESTQYHEQLCKFFDHCSLASIQRDAYKKTKDDVRVMMQSEMKNIETETSKNITAQLVSLVAIFTAIVFVLFGGIGSFSSLMKLQNSSLSMLCSIGVIWTFVISNVVYVFLKFICILTNRDVKSLHILGLNIMLGLIFAAVWILSFFKIYPFL